LSKPRQNPQNRQLRPQLARRPNPRKPRLSKLKKANNQQLKSRYPPHKKPPLNRPNHQLQRKPNQNPKNQKQKKPRPQNLNQNNQLKLKPPPTSQLRPPTPRNNQPPSPRNKPANPQWKSPRAKSPWSSRMLLPPKRSPPKLQL
jgi:hypothetical protein